LLWATVAVINWQPVLLTVGVPLEPADEDPAAVVTPPAAEQTLRASSTAELLVRDAMADVYAPDTARRTAVFKLDDNHISSVDRTATSSEPWVSVLIRTDSTG